MAGFPKLLLNFLAVDYDSYMRRPALGALAEAAARRGTTVVAVNRPLCPFTTVITKRHRVGELFRPPRLEKLGDNLYRYSPKYFIHDRIAGRWSFLESLNNFALRRSLTSLQRKLGIKETQPIVWYNYPEQGYVGRLFEGSFNVYEMYDQLSDPNGRPLEQSQILRRRLIRETNLILTTSHKLEATYGPEYQRSYLFGNGLSRAAFEALSNPAVRPFQKITEIPSPRLGYAGMISKRLNAELLARIARTRPDWQIVLVGPESDNSARSKLSGLANVHFIGAVKQSDIPSVLKAFEVGLLPYQSNDFFDYLNPLKFYEMAAAGLPIVSWPNAEMEQFPQDLIRSVPSEPDRWVTAIETALSRPRDETARLGREIAARFIWEEMAESLLVQLKEILAERKDQS